MTSCITFQSGRSFTIPLESPSDPPTRAVSSHSHASPEKFSWQKQTPQALSPLPPLQASESASKPGLPGCSHGQSQSVSTSMERD